MRFPHLCIIPLVLLTALPAFAGPQTNVLTECIVKSTTQNDRQNLVIWMFSAISNHPTIKSSVIMTSSEREAANKSSAELLNKLLTQDCQAETSKAVQEEGAVAVRESLEVLGKLASTEMLAHPDVDKGLSDMSKYFDQEALLATLQKEELLPR